MIRSRLRRLTFALAAACAVGMLLPCSVAHGTYWKSNVREGSDIVMKDHRWPVWDRGTYYCFWYMSFFPDHPRLGSFYGGLAVSGPENVPGMFMSYWGEVRNVYEGDLFYPHGYGAEGASGGAHGEAYFLRPGSWYRMVQRIYPSPDGKDESLVGWWVKDVERNRWYTHSVVKLPARATGFKGNTGFVEALGPPIIHRAFERRLGYCRKDGKWYKANVVSSAGGKFFKLIDDGTVLRYDRAEKDGPSKGTETFATTQPDMPPLDPPAVTDASAIACGKQVAVSWSVPASASPQLGYRLEVFDRQAAEGDPMAVFEEAIPYVRSRRLDTPRAPRSVRLTVRDIFDQTTSTVVAVRPAAAAPAPASGKLRPGLRYEYYEAPAKTDWAKLPDFAGLTPVKQGSVAALDDTVREARGKLYALRYTGSLRVPADGLYVITVRTCDGSRLSLDGKVVAEHDGLHGRSPRQYALALQKGLHPWKLEYFYGAGRAHHPNLADILSVSWEGPGFGPRRMTQEDFRCEDKGDCPSVRLTLTGDASGGLVKDNLVKIRAAVAARGHKLDRLQIFSGRMLLGTIDGAELNDPAGVSFERLFPAGENRIWARLWYDGHFSTDGDNVLEFRTQDYSDGPWQFIRLGHKFPLGARYKDGVASFAGEGACVGYQQVEGDFTLTAHIAEIALRTPESGVYDQNWIGLYTSEVRGMNPNVGLASTFNEHGFGVYMTAGRGMKGWPDFDDLGGSRMCIPTFPSDHRWLRIVRRGNRVESYTSADGKAWAKAQELISRNAPDKSYAGVWFRAIPGKGRGLFHGAIDRITLEPGKVPAEVRTKVPAEDLKRDNRISAVVQAPGDPEILFARSPDRGLLKSTDRGDSWRPVNNGLAASPDAMAVRSVAVHPEDSSIVLRAAGRAVAGKLKNGLWRSDDGGKSWKLVSREIDFDGRGPTSLFGEVVAFNPMDPNLVLAGGETSGLFVSRDAGLTWMPAGHAGERITCLAFNADSNKNKPVLLMGTASDKELTGLGLGKAAAAVDAPGRLYWGRVEKGKPKLGKSFELEEVAVTNIAFGAYESFATIATSRGLYYTWQSGGVFSKRIWDVPFDRLFTALGYRQYPKQVGPGDIRTKSDTYAAPLNGGEDLVRWVSQRIAMPWRAWSRSPRIADSGGRLDLSAGVSCVLPDRKDNKTLYLVNRHGVFKTSDGGKIYRLVLPAKP